MILAIIALISTPIIIGVIDKARKGAFEDSAYGVIDAGRLYFIDKLADNNTFTGETFDFTKANNLKLSGEAPAGGTLVSDNSGRQALAIYDKDKRWCATKTYEEEKVTVSDYKGSTCDKGSTPTPTATPKPTPTPTPTTPPADTTITDKNKPGNTDGLFTDDYGNVRYRGKSPKNYVTFNNEVWRIIGIVDGKVKLIRDEKVKDLAWNPKGNNEWIGSIVERYLSGEYYNSLNEIAKNQIEVHTYKLGGTHDTTKYSKDIYLLERGTTVYTGRNKEWTGRIGLAYPSDYGYAAGSGCIKDLFNYYLTDACAKDDWMYKSSYYWWLITPISSSSSFVTVVYENGSGSYTDGYYSYYGIRPVLHLKSTVKITGGDGTSANPYTLG